MQLPQGPIGQLDTNEKNVSIIGAGVSGLLMAYYLKKQGFNITVFEKDSDIGGKINTKSTPYGPAETAANAIFTNDDVLELMNELDLDYSSAPHSLKKYVWREGKPQTPPFKFLELIRIIIGAFKKIDKTNLNKKSVYDFFSPMMGKHFAGEIMSAALGGIYAENTRTIHFQSLFKTPFISKRYFGFFRELIKMRKSRSKTKAQSIGFEGGMKTFILALRSKLSDNIQTNIDQKELHHNTIICTDAIDASAILENSEEYTKLSRLLKRIKYNSMFTSTIFMDKPISFLSNGFGVVIPPAENFKNLGILHNTAIFPNRTTEENIYSYTFMTKAKEDIENIITTELNKITHSDFSKHILHRETTQWKRSIPIYDLNRYETILELRAQMNNYQNGLVLFGNYIDGIAVREMVSMAKKFAQNCKS